MANLKDLPTCEKCGLCKTRTHVVVGKGNPQAKILFIGEAPGKNEDLEGKPFVGAAGRELNKLLETIGLTIDDVYITNILKCRPPENRDPSPEEIKTCTPFLIEQICQIRPEIICTLGNYATKFVLAQCVPEKMNSVKGITTLHGKKMKVEFRDMEFTVVPLFHPAAMLYNPPLRQTLEQDFLVLKEILAHHIPPRKKPSLNDYF